MFMNMLGGELPRGNFQANYRAYSVSMLPGQERQDVEKGGKIIMPPSALDTLTRLNIQYPMLFKLTNNKKQRQTHCGVLEFVADEGKIYLPYWMMRNLLLEEGDIVQLENKSMPVATYTKFQPQSAEFLDISNPKAVLENALRSFACLTKGDIIAIKYNDKDYEMCVIETKPATAVSIIECDMNVEFEKPVGYEEPDYRGAARQEEEEEEMAVDVASIIEKNTFRAFCGSGNRLDGKSKNTSSAPAPLEPHQLKRGVPNYDYKRGKITFLRAPRAQNGATSQDEPSDNFEAFSGHGQSLRKKSARRP